MEIARIINFAVAIMMLLYAGYCWVKQGSHAKGKGWFTRQEAPKTFWFNVIFFTLLSILMIIGNLIFFKR